MTGFQTSIDTDENLEEVIDQIYSATGIQLTKKKLVYFAFKEPRVITNVVLANIKNSIKI